MSHAADEFANNVKLAASQQSADYAPPFVYGHIANYDPKTHRVRCILPSVRNEDGVPVLTGWMPLGSPSAGNGWGMQAAPMGGATTENPTGGELVQVQRFDRIFGVGSVAAQVWNQVNVPPFTDLKPGEIGVKSQGGSSIRFKEDKSIAIASEQNLSVSAQGDVTFTVQGSTTINSTGNCTLNSQGNLALTAMGSLVINATSSAISAVGGTIHKLVTDALVALFNSHTHPVSGGTAGPPNQQMTSAQLTSTFEAE